MSYLNNIGKLGTIMFTKINGNRQLFYLLLLLSQEDFKSTKESEIVMTMPVNAQKWCLLLT